jgi:hypothetical protein
MEPVAVAESGDAADCCAWTRAGAEQAADRIRAAAHTEADVNFNGRINFDIKPWLIIFHSLAVFGL